MTAAVDNRVVMGRTLTEFGGYLACLKNPILKGSIYGIGTWNKGDVKQKNVFREAYEMGNAIF